MQLYIIGVTITLFALSIGENGNNDAERDDPFTSLSAAACPLSDPP
jgi:hypothetical protein